MRILRRIRERAHSLYLTFDDGPDHLTTPPILDVLRRRRVRATFFVVAEQATKEPELMTQIISAGHAIGNHSLDHRYRPFFQGDSAMINWIEAAETRLHQLGVSETVGFRPPVGICTPHVFRAVAKMQIPLILWDIRFYDTVSKLGRGRVKRAMARARGGEIILLHDRQKPARLDQFLVGLECLIDEAQSRGFEFEILDRSTAQAEFKQNP
jgi:peptidoglycan/xylan/chitin deacetylase (PgdA/CDA1 family)